MAIVTVLLSMSQIHLAKVLIRRDSCRQNRAAIIGLQPALGRISPCSIANTNRSRCSAQHCLASENTRVFSCCHVQPGFFLKKPAWSGFFGQSREHKYTCLLWNSCHDLPVVIHICSAEFNGGLDDYLQPVADVISFRER